MSNLFLFSPLLIACGINIAGLALSAADGEQTEFSVWGITSMVSTLAAVYALAFRERRFQVESVQFSRTRLRQFTVVTGVLAAVLLVASLAVGAEFFRMSGGIGNDLARFEVRKEAGFGFLARLIYWGAISIAPAAVLLMENRRPKLGVLVGLICLSCSLSSGSKSGVVWAMMSLLLARAMVRPLSLLLLAALGSVGALALASTFMFFGESEDSDVLLAILNRMSASASEGMLLTEDYVREQGLGMGYFLLERPLIALGSTFRIIEKSLQTGDTGVFLANYFGRENNLASYTITPFGLGYLDFGYLGGVLYCAGTAVVGILITRRLLRTVNFKRVMYLPPVLILFAHWCDWGWADGIVAFALIYVIFCLFPYTLIFRSRRVRERAVTLVADSSGRS